MRSREAPELVSEDEVVVLMKSALKAEKRFRQPDEVEGMVEADLERILTWARDTRLNELLLDKVLSGEIVITVRAGDGELMFRLAKA